MESKVKCDVPNCKGYRIPLVSKRDHSLGRRFMRCLEPSCQGFNWIDKDNLSKVYNCFVCGEESHFARNCPHDNLPCNIPSCRGICKLKTSSQPHSLGKKFMKCQECDKFTWWSPICTPANDISNVSKPSTSASSTSFGNKKVTIKIEITLEDLCNDLGDIKIE